MQRNLYSSLAGLEFRQWAEFGTQEYGRTAWFFLRELAQNSRDAGARSIHVQAGRDGLGREYLSFTDDGGGMTYDHARSYLFRLYSSSKEGDDDAAGMYGIGFWTILHFDPEEIIIESRKGGENWKIILDRDLHWRRENGAIPAAGTRVILARSPRCAGAEAFVKEVKRELNHHCGFLRRRSPPFRSLPVFFKGESLASEFTLPGTATVSLRRGSVEAVAGIGDLPSVKLYARGLFIWEGMFLEELSSTASIPAGEFSPGSYPVLLLNGNHLDGTIFRREAVAGKELDRVIQCGRRALSELIPLHARGAYLERGWKRWLQRIRGAGRTRLVPVLRYALLFLLPLVALFWFIRPQNFRLPPAEFSRISPHTVALGTFDAGAASSVDISLSYTPPLPLFFRAFAAEHYDGQRGFYVRERTTSPPVVNRNGGAVDIRIAEAKGGIYLPVPSGYSLVPGTLSSQGDGGPLPAVCFGHAWRAEVKAAGALAYRCLPEEPSVLDAREREKLLFLPGELDSELSKVFPRFMGESLTLQEKLDRVQAELDAGWRFSVRGGEKEKPGTEAGETGWYDRVSMKRSGDCDILNGVAALYLRSLGVPARLAVGWTGNRGRADPRLHAWVEYYADGWHPFDVTLGMTSASPSGGLPNVSAEAESPPAFRPFPYLYRYLLYWLLPLWGMAAAGALFFLRKKSRARIRGTPAEMRSQLGAMLPHLLKNRRLLGIDGDIWRLPLLPLLGGGRISVRQAAVHAENRELFKGSPDNPIAVELAGAGFRVLDTGETAFQSFFQLFPRIRDLDTLNRWQCREPLKNGIHAVERMFADFNRSVSRLGAVFPPFLLAPGLKEGEWHAVELVAKRRISAAGLPASFFAVSLEHPEFRSLAEEWGRNREEVLFRLFRKHLPRFYPDEPDRNLLSGVFARHLGMDAGGAKP